MNRADTLNPADDAALRTRIDFIRSYLTVECELAVGEAYVLERLAAKVQDKPDREPENDLTLLAGAVRGLSTQIGDRIEHIMLTVHSDLRYIESLLDGQSDSSRLGRRAA